MLLRFTAGFITPILKGRKTQTLRKRSRLQRGDVFDAGCRYGDPPFAQLRVTKVDVVTRDDLTEADARREGALSLSHLLDALDALYPDVPEFVRVRFVRQRL